ncbi:hypothetical protein [Amycolatopsis sp. FU40]|nr:hypothetical protein [Amycolatopsis sp. FU40]
MSGSGPAPRRARLGQPRLPAAERAAAPLASEQGLATSRRKLAE